MRKIHDLMIHVLLIFLELKFAIQQQSTKLDYEVNPEYQNLIDNQSGLIPQPTFSTEPESFVYGGIFTLTAQSNGALINGYQQALAMQCAIGDVNRISRLRGVNTTFYWNIFDDQGNPAIAMRSAVEFLSAGVPVTIGPTEADSAAAVASLYANFNYTVLSGSVSADILSDSSVYGSYYRTLPPDQKTAGSIADLLLYFGWTLVTPIYTRNVYGLSGQRQFTATASERGILVTCSRLLTSGDTSGVSNVISCLTTSQSTVVILWMSAQDAANVIAEFYQSGLLPDITFIAPDSWADIADMTAYADGGFNESYLEGSLGVAPKSGNQDWFTRCVSKLDANSETLPFFLDFWESGLRCQVTNDTRVEICPEEIWARAAFPNNNCRCREGDTLGLVDPTHRINYIYDAVFAVYVALEQIQNNCTGLSEETGIAYCNATEISTSDLERVIGIAQFNGLTGPISFQGNDPSTIEYEIIQRRANGALVVVGTDSPLTNVTIDSSLLIFKNGKVPVSEIVPSEITFSEPLGIVALIFIVIGLLISFGFSIYFFVNRNEKVIKKTSPFFSQLMLLGIILCITSQILWDITQSTLTCILKIWLLAIGFGLIMGNLLAKTYRIFKIFHNARVTSLVIRDVDLLKFSAAIIILEVILLSLYTFTSGLPTPIIIQSTSDSLLKIVKCEVPSSFVQTGGIIWLLGVNFLLVLAAVIIAYLTRNVDSAFNESRYIAYTVYIYLLVTIILLPLYYTAGDSSSSNSRQFIIRTIAVLVPMFFTLGALFLPKIYLVNKAKRAERKMAEEASERGQGRRRRAEEFGMTTTGGGTVAPVYQNNSMAGAFSKALRGLGAGGGTATSSGDSPNDMTNMPGGARVSAIRKSTSGTATGTGTNTTTSNSNTPAPSSGGTTTQTASTRPPSTDYSSLINNISKRRE